MAAANGRSPTDVSQQVNVVCRHAAGSVADVLFKEPYLFDIYQAIRLLERLQPHSQPVAKSASPQKEIVRFGAHLSFNFPPSTIHDLQPATEEMPPSMIVTVLGLTGPSGVLPRFYTELLFQIKRDVKHGEKFALRDWLDLFNHRLISLFYRAWEKYRFYIPHERGDYAASEPDAFTQALFSLIGLGLPSLRNRLRVAIPDAPKQEQTLSKIDDLALLRFGGFLAHRPRCAISLQVMLCNYFKIPVEVHQFQGQWLRLEPDNQSSLGEAGNNHAMGINAVIGDRIWDVQSKIRLRLGPLTYEQFLQFLPDRSPVPQRKAFYLLSQLTRLYVGSELDIEIQLLLKAGDVPMCRMGKGGGPLGSRIGWNCWSRQRPRDSDADEPVFTADETVFLPGTSRAKQHG